MGPDRFLRTAGQKKYWISGLKPDYYVVINRFQLMPTTRFNKLQNRNIFDEGMLFMKYITKYETMKYYSDTFQQLRKWYSGSAIIYAFNV